MSSILKALKKIEDETAREETDAPVIEVGARPNLSGRAKGGRGIQWTGMVFIVFICGFLWVLYQRPGLIQQFLPPAAPIQDQQKVIPETPSVKASDAPPGFDHSQRPIPEDPKHRSVNNPPLPFVTPGGKSQHPQPDGEGSSAQSDPVSSPKAMPVFRPRPVVAPEIQAARTHRVSPPSENKTSSEPNETIIQGETADPGITAQNSPQSGPASQPVETQPEKPAPPVFIFPKTLPEKPVQLPQPKTNVQIVQPAPQESAVQKVPAGDHQEIPEASQKVLGMEIQALVWAPDPEGRMAVVNGSIVREQGAVGNFIISHIGDGYLIVEKDGTTWRVNFDLR